MSRTDYSKWDKLELSDDDEVEVHPNIDKASFIRWKQADIHRKREERKLQIAQWKQELSTNAGLLERIQKLCSIFKSGQDQDKTSAVDKLVKDTKLYETERKPVLFDKDHADYLNPKSVDEVFSMLISRLCDDNKLPVEVAAFQAKMPAILLAEIPKLNARQTEVSASMTKEELEQNKKITSDNIFTEKFSKTAINRIVEPEPIKTKKAVKKTSKAKDVEVLNPNFQEHQKPSSDAESDTEETLGDLEDSDEKMMLEFSNMKSFEEAFQYIQGHRRVVSRELSDHLMSRAFKAEFEGNTKEARQCARWALVLSYCVQMGPDGPGVFFKRMIHGGPAAVQVFEQDFAQTYDRIHKRCIEMKNKDKELDDSNSNLTPEQAVAFKSFPKVFQQALMANDMNKINEAFAAMDEKTAKEVMDKCQSTGLISVLSDDQAKEYIQADETLAESVPTSKVNWVLIVVFTLSRVDLYSEHIDLLQKTIVYPTWICWFICFLHLKWTYVMIGLVRRSMRWSWSRSSKFFSSNQEIFKIQMEEVIIAFHW